MDTRTRPSRARDYFDRHPRTSRLQAACTTGTSREFPSRPLAAERLREDVLHPVGEARLPRDVGNTPTPTHSATFTHTHLLRVNSPRGSSGCLERMSLPAHTATGAACGPCGSSQVSGTDADDACVHNHTESRTDRPYTLREKAAFKRPDVDRKPEIYS
jgi:hypothetical protein